jgi:hypothetical protein
MDKRIESFLADVLALEGEDASTVREAVRDQNLLVLLKHLLELSKTFDVQIG